MASTISLRIGTQEAITAPAFIDSFRSFLAVLEELDAAISHNPHGSLIWELAVLNKTSPPMIGLKPRIKHGAKDISDVLEVQLIENADLLSLSPERTQFLSDAALAKIERLAKRATKLGTMAVSVNGQPGKQHRQSLITAYTLENVRKLTGIKYSAYGYVVGNLDAISVHNGNEFRVWDEATNKPIRCTFSEGDLERVKSLLGCRASVAGMIHSNSAGNPISISVEDLEQIEREALPTIEEMSGLIEDFTAGKSLKEYMEELSDE